MYFQTNQLLQRFDIPESVFTFHDFSKFWVFVLFERTIWPCFKMVSRVYIRSWFSIFWICNFTFHTSPFQIYLKDLHFLCHRQPCPNVSSHLLLSAKISLFCQIEYWSPAVRNAVGHILRNTFLQAVSLSCHLYCCRRKYLFAHLPVENDL